MNGILRNIGERQVATLVDSTRGDVAASISELDQQSREVQAEGWSFNMEIVTLPLTIRSEVDVPSNALDVRTLGTYGREEIVVRGDRLYNKTLNTFTFTEAPEVETIVQLPFESLPEHARYYIMVRAARVVAQSRVGDPAIVQFSHQDEQMARIQLEARELESEDHTAFDNRELLKLTNPRLR